MNELNLWKKYKTLQDVQTEQKTVSAIPVCRFIRVLKHDKSQLPKQDLLDMWLARRRKETR